MLAKLIQSLADTAARRWRALALALAPALIVAGVVAAQTSITFPVPSGIWSAGGAVVVSQDANSLTGVAAGTSGQLLTGAGAATAPAWQTVVFSASFTPTGTAANTCAEQELTVTGVVSTDVVQVTAPGGTVAVAGARASGDDTVEIMFCNPTASLATADSGTYRFLSFGAS